MLETISELRLELNSLVVFRNLLQDDVLKALSSVMDNLIEKDRGFEGFISSYSEFYYRLIQNCQTGSLQDYLLQKITFDDNAFTRKSQAIPFKALDSFLKDAAYRDLAYFSKLMLLSPRILQDAALERFDTAYQVKKIAELPSFNPDAKQSDFKGFFAWREPQRWLRELGEYCYLNGCGRFARYHSFTWQRQGEGGFLQGVSCLEPIRFGDLIGYDKEHQIVKQNTKDFLDGFPGNNLLLYGDRGTGKSSAIKALVNEFGKDGLRVIEIPKTQLIDLSQILRIIKGKRQKFIIFIDDLSFQDNEKDYTALKAVLEGSLESRPKNVLIYATSNRRHLVKERFRDRIGISSNDADDQVRASDNLEEMFSLADRFGVTVTFSSPSQDLFLEIVCGLAKKRGLNVPAKVLQREAIRWEMNYNVRSPRTAKQFIDWYEARVFEEKADKI